MSTCQEIDSLITPYVDRVAESAQAVAVESHTAICVACRRKLDAERGVRQLLESHAATLRVTAPSSLRSRCAALARAAPLRPRHVAARYLPLSAAAAVLLVIAGMLAYGLLDRSGRLIAAEFTADHIKCFSYEPSGTDRPSRADVAAYFQETASWMIKVPDNQPSERVELLVGRRCFWTHGRMAHVLYRYQGEPISVFVLPGHAAASEEYRLLGHAAIMWSTGGDTFVVIANRPGPRLRAFAALVKRG